MSRLLDNSDQIRDNLDARNLYTPENPYRIEEGSVVETVNAIAGIISPFNSFDLSNTVIARLAGVNTPITQIGLEMLGKQFAATVKSLGSAEVLPAVNFSNLFDGNPETKLFTKKIDLQITRRESQTTIGRIIEELTGNYRPINPFQVGSTDEDFFLQTGKGQQLFISGALNKNIYRKSNNTWITAYEGEGFQYPQLPIRTYFTGLDENINPYNQYLLFDVDTINNRLNSQNNTFLSNLQGNRQYEYGSTQTYLDALGKLNTKTNASDNGDNVLNDPFNFTPTQGGFGIFSTYNDYGLDEDTSSKIIWGRDGTSSEYESDRNAVDQNPNANPLAGGDSTSANYYGNVDRFNNLDSPETGLLNFTKELLNSKGKYANFDLTKKKFIERDGDIYFNGSPLSREIDGTENRSRQHNVTDPYDRFVKAIRFNGNIRYNGNKNSVIHRSVIPKIHPVIDQEGKINVKNMMFSIENLAARTFKDDENGVAYLDDNFGTQLPFCEVGENGGRLMWFAPYDIKLSEQAIARHETTMFIGRGEPIYTYNNSERLANLSFKLLIDYPPQVKGMDHISASRFFAFGGSGSTTPAININQAQNDLNNLIEQRDSIKPEVTQEQPEIPSFSPISFYYPNDVPRIGEESTAISTWINIYEDGELTSADPDGKDYGLNVDFAVQIDPIIETLLNPDYREFMDITIVGEATRLFVEGGENLPSDNPASIEYNESLGQRRADALKEYINQRYKAIYGRTLQQDGINVTTRSLGQERATEDTDSANAISSQESKSYRVATVSFTQNQNTTERTQPLTKQQIADREELDRQIQELDLKIKKAKEQLQRGFECTFNQYILGEDGVFKGFRGTQVNKFIPVFHSQTPEDFHRRLTFLHQCTRQGNAVRKNQSANDGTVNFVAKNAVFGRQPIQVLRIGDFFHTKVVIDNISFDYTDAPWDMNPEGMGMQFMIADITIQMKVIGGQSLATPIDALQNAVSFNYYANSTYYNNGIYQTPTKAENEQLAVKEQTIKEFNQGDESAALENTDAVSRLKDLNRDQQG